MELIILYHEEMQLTPKSPKGCWVARFRTEGLTAYGETVEIATHKLVNMLKTKRAKQESKQ